MSATLTRAALPSRQLAINTTGFLIAFAAWVMFGPSARRIAEELSLSQDLVVWIKAAPILTGAAFRAPVGALTDRLGARVVFTALLALGAVAVALMSLATTAGELLFGGVAMGLVGTTYVVGIQSVSSSTHASRQGAAMGIFGFGTAGTAISTLLMPWLLEAMSWREAFRLYAVALALVAVMYALGVRDVKKVERVRRLGAMLKPLMDRRTWALGLYYMATFGVFVAGALSFGDLYIDRYGVGIKTAGALATSFVFTAAASRVPGGELADRFGARAVLGVSLALTALFIAPTLLALALAPTVALIFLAGVAMGVGMSATYTYIPELFPEHVGAVGGLVGALGGLAGFFLPLLSAAASARFETKSAALMPLCALIMAALLVLIASRPQSKS